MKKGLTELVMILDKSGSMAGLETDTIGGYNAMLEKQKALDGECRITTVLFDNSYTLLHDRSNLQAVSPITREEYQAGGTTALLDAIGRSIRKIETAQQHIQEDYRAEKVIFVIITDGAENASRLYSQAGIRQMIEHKKARCGWEFIFLGANMDAAEMAEGYGIQADRAQTYHADSRGIGLNFKAVGCAVASFRQDARLPEDWNAEIERDYKGRGFRRS